MSRLEQRDEVVNLVVDPAFGERIWSVAAEHETWVVPSDVNRTVVDAIWKSGKDDKTRHGVTCWSNAMPAATEQDWLAMLDTIEMHHGAYWADPPMLVLQVYGASVRPEIEAALRAHDYEKIEPTEFGFVAYKGDWS